MTTRQKEIELSDYIYEWAIARYPDWELFRKSEYDCRHTGILQLPHGESLLIFLESIVENIANHLICEHSQHIIPTCFSSISQLLHFLTNFKAYVENNYHLLESQFDGEKTKYIVVDMANMCHDIISMTSRCLNTYLESDSVPIPYIQARRFLFDNDIHGFVDIMKSLIASVPYGIHKAKISEDYFHTMFHVISSIIGLNPESEVETSDGRIDVTFECPVHFFIIEFKYSSDDTDLSKVAMNQIKENRYGQKYHIRCKPIIAIGISFSKQQKTINGYVSETIFTPSISKHTF